MIYNNVEFVAKYSILKTGLSAVFCMALFFAFLYIDPLETTYYKFLANDVFKPIIWFLAAFMLFICAFCLMLFVKSIFGHEAFKISNGRIFINHYKKVEFSLSEVDNVKFASNGSVFFNSGKKSYGLSSFFFREMDAANTHILNIAQLVNSHGGNP